MKIVVIGTGYVGLVSGACLSDLGHEVICIDHDAKRIKDLQKGKIPIYEPGLDTIVIRNIKSKRLSFSTDIKKSLPEAKVVLLAVGTPTDEKTGRADLTDIFAATKQVVSCLEDEIVFVTKSTVPVGTGREIKKIFTKYKPKLNCHIVSNPEFLREGSAINDFFQPDRIIIGVESTKAKNIMGEMYKKLADQGCPILYSDVATAELIKYASNAFLATKIVFINEMADLCEKVGANIEIVGKGMGMDPRIGNKHLNPGPGYGGSCFPKDTLALLKIAEDNNSITSIVEAVVNSNDQRKYYMAQKIIAAMDSDIAGKKIAIWGLTFKANTDDMRASPSLTIIPALTKAKAKLQLYDPAGMERAKKYIKDKVKYCDTALDAIKDADALVIVTEWSEFAKIDLKSIKKAMKGRIIVDLRNLLNPEDAIANGFKYISIGR